MIIGYYEQSFFGGGTYYKLTKRDNEDKYKLEYSKSEVPNYIPNAEEYIKKYEILQVDNEYFEGKIKIEYIEPNLDIESIKEYALKCDWKRISRKKYEDNDILDGLGWDFYIEFGNQKYLLSGYEKFPEEIIKIVDMLENISKIYLEEIVKNQKDIEIINKHKNKNITVMKHLQKKKIIDRKTLKDFIDKYKKYE